ncbi:hypothetical protein BDZ88DRAFT_456453 [Geranomyces variabilis]|nr:hypothetical protein BDZ88DRAFT_456453 [Geranomyces variabilis]KAJ3132812.1 hypothetical protein HDU90_006702 [Geranomyces variabilis]
MAEYRQATLCVVCGLPPGTDQVWFKDPDASPSTHVPVVPTPDHRWLRGICGILRDGALISVWETADEDYPSGEELAPGAHATEVKFSNPDRGTDDHWQYGPAVPVHPYCVAFLRKELLPRWNRNLSLAKLFRFVRWHGSADGELRSSRQHTRSTIYSLECLEHREGVILAPENDWTLAPYDLELLPTATMDLPVVRGPRLTSEQDKAGLLSLSDDILGLILSTLVEFGHGASVVNLQRASRATRNRLLTHDLARHIWRDYAFGLYWWPQRIQLEDGTVAHKGGAEYYEATKRIHVFTYVSACMRSPNARSLRRVVGAFNQYARSMIKYLEELGPNCEWPGPHEDTSNVARNQNFTRTEIITRVCEQPVF